MGRFHKGLFFGGLLGASLVWLTLTPKGKKVREELFDHAAIVYARLKEEVVKSEMWKEMTESEFVETVKRITDTYAREIGMVKEMSDIVEKIVRTQWKQFRAQLPESTKQ